jgi:hypothetical protein
MKQGRSIMELAAEIDRQSHAKKDYVADTRKLEMETVFQPGGNPTTALKIVNGEDTRMPIGQTAHRQIAERVQIPAKYYDRMMVEAPGLLVENVNHWFKNSPDRRLIRTLDGRARAFLSDRYQRIDNNHIAEAVLPVLSETKDIKIVSLRDHRIEAVYQGRHPCGTGDPEYAARRGPRRGRSDYPEFGNRIRRGARGPLRQLPRLPERHGLEQGGDAGEPCRYEAGRR